MLTCAQSRGAAAAPAVAEPAAAPVPPTAAPVEATDAQIVARDAVDGAPEEHVLAFPFFGNEVRIGEQVIKNASAQDRLPGKLLAEIVALDTALLLGGREIESVLLGFFAPLERTTLLMFLHFPAVGHEGVGIAVDEMFDRSDF